MGWAWKRRSATKVVVACAVALLLLAVASSAGATATTTKAAWYSGETEGSVAALTGKPTITAEIGEDPAVGKHFVFKTSIEERAVSITANAASCLECVVSNEISGLSGPEVAMIRGKLLFAESTVSVSEGNCVIGKIITVPLLMESDYMEGEMWITRMFPQSGGTPLILTFENEGAKKCPIAGAWSYVGYQYAAFGSKTGVFQKEEALHFSAAISSAASGEKVNGPITWQRGSPKVHLLEVFGTLDFKLGGSAPYFGMK